MVEVISLMKRRLMADLIAGNKDMYFSTRKRAEILLFMKRYDKRQSNMINDPDTIRIDN